MAKWVTEPDSNPSHQNSVTFSAIFGRQLQEILVADIGADDNLADSAPIQRIQAVSETVQLHDLVRPVLFSLAVG